jgi:hypothetical protein
MQKVELAVQLSSNWRPWNFGTEQEHESTAVPMCTQPQKPYAAHVVKNANWNRHRAHAPVKHLRITGREETIF